MVNLCDQWSLADNVRMCRAIVVPLTKGLLLLSKEKWHNRLGHKNRTPCMPDPK